MMSVYESSSSSALSLAPRQQLEPVAQPEDLIRLFLWDRSCVEIPADQDYMFDTRLGPLLANEGVTDLQELAELLYSGTGRGRQLGEAVVDAMTTNETNFFRDAPVFDHLRHMLLPSLLSDRRDAAEFRIWSAASSTGQEAVSLAILISEVAPGRPFSILGTDISRRVVEEASTGHYRPIATNRGLSARTLLRWFDQDGTSYVVKPELLTNIEYRQHNLTQPLEDAAPFDLVLLRNVLIYFNIETRQQVFSRVADAMNEGGAVLLGAAERVFEYGSRFAPRGADQNRWLERIN